MLAFSLHFGNRLEGTAAPVVPEREAGGRRPAQARRYGRALTQQANGPSPGRRCCAERHLRAACAAQPLCDHGAAVHDVHERDGWIGSVLWGVAGWHVQEHACPRIVERTQAVLTDRARSTQGSWLKFRRVRCVAVGWMACVWCVDDDITVATVGGNGPAREDTPERGAGTQSGRRYVCVRIPQAPDPACCLPGAPAYPHTPRDTRQRPARPLLSSVLGGIDV